ncbi:MAG: NUDIX hydrolase [candidate division KSB1 bacterium]
MNYNFCPSCGHALQSSPNFHQGKPHCMKCGFIHFNNPRGCVAAIMQRKNEILLVQRAQEPFKLCWDFPGGFLEAGESPQEGLRREMREELQIAIEPFALFGVYADHYGTGGEPVLIVYYLCELRASTVNPQEEIADARWFELSALPEALAFDHTPAVIADLRKRSLGRR